jgi:hypothetical protein
VIVAIAKTFAELTCRQDGMIRQQLIERLQPFLPSDPGVEARLLSRQSRS